jgi:hypothetical protein
MQNFKSLLWAGGWLNLISSVLFLTASFFLYQHTRSFVESASRAQGSVTKLVLSGKDYFPVYTFEDSQGKKHSIKSLSGSYPAAYNVGDSVAVIYQPDNPDNAEINSFWMFGSGPLHWLVLVH